MGGLRAAVVILIEATDFGLLAILEQQNFVDDRDFGLDLDQRKGLAHGFADVLGMRVSPRRMTPRQMTAA